MIRACCTGVFALAACVAVAQDNPIKLDVDFATFAYDDATSLVEVYLAIGSNSVEYVQDSTGMVAELPVFTRLDHATITTLLEGSPDPVWTDSVLLQFTIDDSLQLREGQHFLHLMRAGVPPGEYELTVEVPPKASGQPGQTVKRDVLVPDYSRISETSISDIELATSITRADDRADDFYKNGLSIKPNPYILFGSNLPRMFYYFETYNAAVEDSTYTAYTFVSQSSIKQPFGKLESKSERHVRSPDAIIGSFDVSGLSTGSYQLHVILLDAQNRSMAEQSRKFFVYNPSVSAQAQQATTEPAYETTFYATMTEEELDDQIRYARIIATGREDDRLKSAKNIDAKREVLLDFWSKRDPDPTTPVNEVREEYFTRVQYARERYSNTHSEGWQTDRGRVYLKYGAPAHVSPHHYDTGMSPYEVWEYDNIPGEGHSIFVFGDVSGFNEFELIHSDVTGERQSVDWRAELRE